MRLGDIINIKHGFAFSGNHIIEEDNGVVLVTPGNFRIGGGFQEKKCKFFDGEIPKEYILNEGDFIVTMTDLSKTIDTLGYSALIPKSSSRTYLHNQRIGLVQFKNDSCDRGYIYWLMRTRGYQRTIANTSTGSTVHHTSPAKICDFEFTPPSIETQRRIAEILSRYDSLIENYQRQIKLLEEAAQRLYKEWFIDLHFPGHETTPIIDGIPEGWEKKKFGEIIETTSGGTPSRRKENFFSGSILWVKTKELNDGFIFDTEEKITEEALNQSSAKMVPEGSLLLAMYGATIGKLGVAGQSLSCNQACCVFLLNSKEYYRWFLYNWLMYNRTFLISQGKGAAQPNLSQELIKNFEIVIPSSNLLMIFHRLADKIYTESAKLQAQIRNLTEARDRLLPKLMSGEIDIV